MTASRSRSLAVLLPLFSARTGRQAGIGEIPDLVALADFAAACGASMIQLLPLLEPVGGDQSPYSSRSAFAIDPIYVGLDRVEDLGPRWEDALEPAAREALERSREAVRVDYGTVRRLKAQALEVAFRRFRDAEWKGRSARATDLRRFAEEERSWLDDYALFRALEEAFGGAYWREWPEGVRDRRPEALAERRAALEERVLFYEYVQWLAGTQWRAARAEARARGVRLAGDLPFMVAAGSADVWAHQDMFRLDATVGAPPDALAREGQDWGLPPYRWDALERANDRWIRDRAQRAAELYDAYRVDHVVGFYRTYVIEQGRSAKEGHFVPEGEPAQKAQGERVLGAMRSAGAELIAEDLGTIPPFVRHSLAGLAVPGYRVLRWEREWEAPGRPFIDPRSYPARSVATSGTHDTTTLAVWWEEELDHADRRAIAALAALAPIRPAVERGERTCSGEVLAALLDALYGAGSDLAIVPVQDLFGAREQVNVPGTFRPENWSYRLPFRLEEALARDDVRPAVERSRGLAAKHGRV
jgi:4-alpha-glucanotransferase